MQRFIPHPLGVSVINLIAHDMMFPDSFILKSLAKVPVERSNSFSDAHFFVAVDVNIYKVLDIGLSTRIRSSSRFHLANPYL